MEISQETLKNEIESFKKNAGKVPFKLLYSEPKETRFDSTSTPDLYILDSSFNPPTRAHLHLALSLLPPKPPARILLLLSLGNADKPAATPEEFYVRLHLVRHLVPELRLHTSKPIVDVGICVAPRFVDKESAIRSGYPSVRNLVFGVGWDTFIRIVDGKYYKKEEGGLQVVRDFLGRREEGGCELKVLGREGGEDMKLLKEWGCEMVESGAYDKVSSTRIRNATRDMRDGIRKDEAEETLLECTIKGIKDQIVDEGLYSTS